MSGVGFTTADFVVLGVLAISGLFAFSRGFVREVISIATWVGSALVALYGFGKLRAYAHHVVHPDWVADIVTAVGLFFLAFVAITLLARPVVRRSETSDLRTVDRLLGLLFGLVRGAVLVSLAYLVVSWLIPPADMPGWVKRSFTLPYVERGAALLRGIAPHASDTNQPAGAQKPKDAAPSEEKGYKSEERQEMDRLMQTKP